MELIIIVLCAVFSLMSQVSTLENDDAKLNITYQDSAEISGSVEIYQDGNWYPLCADLWNITDANVTCRTAGYYNGAVNYSVTFDLNPDFYYFRYSGFNCLGTEDKLKDCKKGSPAVISNYTCTTYGVAVTVCAPNNPINYGVIFGSIGGCLGVLVLGGIGTYGIYRWRKKRSDDIAYASMINNMI